MSSISLVDFAAQEKDPMRRGVLQQITHESIFFKELRFVPVEGFSYQYATQSKMPGITFRAMNGTYAADGGIVNPGIENLKIFGGIVNIDHALQGSSTHTNAVTQKIRSAGLFFDYNVINGNPAVDPLQFYGLKNRIIGGQIIYAGANGAALTLGLVDQILDKVAGPNNEKLLIMSKYQRRAFKGVVLTTATGARSDDVVNEVQTYDGAKILVLDEDDMETAILPQTETRGNSAVTGSLYCIRPGKDPEGEYVQGLIRGNMVEHKPLAQTNTLVGDLIEMVAGLGVFHGRAAARLAGLT